MIRLGIIGLPGCGKTTVFNALIDTIDLTQLAKLDAEAAREEIRDIVSEIISIKNGKAVYLKKTDKRIASPIFFLLIPLIG